MIQLLQLIFDNSCSDISPELSRSWDHAQ